MNRPKSHLAKITTTAIFAAFMLPGLCRAQSSSDFDDLLPPSPQPDPPAYTAPDLSITTQPQDRSSVIEFLDDRLQFDLFSLTFYSRTAFTDLVDPFNDYLSLAIFKTSFWLDERKTFGPYAEYFFFGATEEEFPFLRFNEIAVGFQGYPLDFIEGPLRRYVRPLRLFGQYQWRDYYDQGNATEQLDWDARFGADYFLDNLYRDQTPLYYRLFTSATYRKSNFERIVDDYEGLFWFGDALVGPRIAIGDNAMLVPFVGMEWTYSPRYEERWFENFFRISAGGEFYPFKGIVRDSRFAGLLSRVNLFAKYIQNVAWLGDDPPGGVEEWDFQVGIRFSTAEFFRRD